MSTLKCPAGILRFHKDIFLVENTIFILFQMINVYKNRFPISIYKLAGSIDVVMTLSAVNNSSTAPSIRLWNSYEASS